MFSLGNALDASVCVCVCVSEARLRLSLIQSLLHLSPHSLNINIFIAIYSNLRSQKANMGTTVKASFIIYLFIHLFNVLNEMKCWM